MKIIERFERNSNKQLKTFGMEPYLKMDVKNYGYLP